MSSFSDYKALSQAAVMAITPAVRSENRGKQGPNRDAHAVSDIT